MSYSCCSVTLVTGFFGDVISASPSQATGKKVSCFSSGRSGIGGRALPAMSALPSLTASRPETVLNGCSSILPCFVASKSFAICLTNARAVARSPRQMIVGSAGAAALALAGAAFLAGVAAVGAAAAAALTSIHRQTDSSSANTRQATNWFTDEFHSKGRGLHYGPLWPVLHRQKLQGAVAHDREQQLPRMLCRQRGEVGKSGDLHLTDRNDQVALLQAVRRGAAAGRDAHDTDAVQAFTAHAFAD